jgi:2-oxoglutarate ferredoxin oxidoreductase subunit delta
MEGREKLAEIRIFADLCKGVEECGICVEMCPKKLFRSSKGLNPKGYRPPEVNEAEACTGCENCMIFCPDLAIAVKGRKAPKGVKK